MNDQILASAKMLWDFHSIYDPLKTADVIVGFGSYDLRVAERVAELYNQGLAPLIVLTGHSGNWTQGLYPASEAEAFADVLTAAGVPDEAIILEKAATNIGENILFTKELMAPGALSAIMVTKPQTQRRVRATAARRWSEASVMVTAPLISFEEQPTDQVPMELLINELTGDLARILEYPAKGFQVAQAVPLDVLEAYEFLIAQGYDKH
ncbi:YdcF family protein [Paenochrobactrum sp. BZR 588]|uniref:YdcF family protein n=1 Tax=unclassified Paenochrobactrum TaxID=2639760 RepID=UPI003851943F